MLQMMRTSRFQPAWTISRNVHRELARRGDETSIIAASLPRGPRRVNTMAVTIKTNLGPLKAPNLGAKNVKTTTAARVYDWNNGSRFCRRLFSCFFWWRLIGVARSLHIWLIFLRCILRNYYEYMLICLSGNFPMGISISDWNQMVYSPLRLKKLQWDHGNPPMIPTTGEVSRSVQKQMQGTRGEQAEMATKLIFSQKCFC